MIYYRVRAWEEGEKHQRLMFKRYYKVCENNPRGNGCNTYIFDFYDFLLHLLLDHLFTVEVKEISKEDLPKDAVISVL